MDNFAFYLIGIGMTVYVVAMFSATIVMICARQSGELETQFKRVLMIGILGIVGMFVGVAGVLILAHTAWTHINL